MTITTIYHAGNGSLSLMALIFEVTSSITITTPGYLGLTGNSLLPTHLSVVSIYRCSAVLDADGEL